MRSRWGWKRTAAGLALVAGVGLGVILPPAGSAGAAASFNGIAAADVVRVRVVVPGAPLSSSVFDGGAWSSQAVVTSSGSSEAFASNPYPGESIVTLPGTLAGAGVAGVPEYPLYAASSYPQTQHAEVNQGLFRLAADSTATTSEAFAGTGQSGEQKAGATSAVASVRQDADGVVLAHSESRLDGFAAGPLKIGAVVSAATVRLRPDGSPLEKSSQLDVTGISVNDVAVRLTPKGLVAGDQTLPLDATAIQAALEQAGLSIAYVAPEDIPNGVMGAGVRVTSKAGSPGSEVSVTWFFGRSLAAIESAKVDSGLLPELPPAEGFASSPPPAGDGVSSPPPAAESVVSSPPPAVALTASRPMLPGVGESLPFTTASNPSASDPAQESASASSSGAIPTVPAGAPGSGAVADAAAPPAGLATNQAAAHSRPDATGLYLVFLAAAAAMVVLTRVLGLFGVRLRWT